MQIKIPVLDSQPLGKVTKLKWRREGGNEVKRGEARSGHYSQQAAGRS